TCSPTSSTRSSIRESDMNRLLSRNRLAAAGLLIVIVLTVTAALAPWLAPYDPAAQDLPLRLTGPSPAHPFGTDELGRDILSRVLVGTRVSMIVGAAVVVLAGSVGVLVGGLAGFLGGRFDTLVTV